MGYKLNIRYDLSLLFALGYALFFFACSQNEKPVVRPGLDVLIEEKIGILDGKRIGIISNPTGVNRHGKHIFDLLVGRPEFEVIALFGPEHGVRGDRNELIPRGEDEKSGLPVYSLYGGTRKPTPEMLQGIDLLLFDIQDIGARFYTYKSTMAYAMEAAAENGIPFVVLDRLNPINGIGVEGPVLETHLKSFVGVAPISVRYGMTMGELAKMFNEEGWLEGEVRCDLTVIRMDGWRRSQWFDETGLPWVVPSPNMPDLNTAVLYPGLCFLEATNVSEGRGTDEPFKQIGAPWINGPELVKALENQHIPGVCFSPVMFIPKDMVGRAMNPKYEGELCRGIKIEVTDRNNFASVSFGIRLLCTIRDLYRDHFDWRAENFRRMELLTGTEWIPQAIAEGETAESIVTGWQEGLEEFLSIRRRYLMYE
jgi:uncharacterized protein YbbC (DUF1343 family)